MGDLHHAKYLFDNGASLHRTFSGKYASALDYILSECKTDPLGFLLPYAGNQVNCPDAGGRFPVHLCIEYNFVVALRFSTSRPAYLIRILTHRSAPTRSTGYCPNVWKIVHPR
jgi:hypothetical protein